MGDTVIRLYLRPPKELLDEALLKLDDVLGRLDKQGDIPNTLELFTARMLVHGALTAIANPELVKP